MNISMGVILKELGDLRFLTNVESAEDFPIKLFQIWDGQKPEHDVLYIVRPEDIKNNPGIWNGGSIIGYGLETKILKTSASKWIDLENGESIFSIVNKLQKIFQKFNEWTERVENLLNKSVPITEVLNDLESTYGLMSMFVNKNLKFLSMSKTFPKNNPWAGNGDYMSLDLLNELLTDEEFRSAQKHDDVFIYENPFDWTSAYSYCYNVKKNKEYLARLLVQTYNGKKSFGVSCITGYIGKRIEGIVNQYNFGEDDIYADYAFKEMIGDMLKGIRKNSIEIRECLKGLEWEQNHGYQINIVQFLQKEVPNASHIYYKTRLEEFFGKCYVVEENNKFICLVNLTLLPESKRNNRNDLSVFLRDNLCKVGVSNEFHDLAQLNEYFMEADIALFIGINYNNTAWYYKFSDMVLPYLKHQMIKEISLEHLIHPSLKLLQEYDKRENTQLVKTVEVFIRNKYNVTHTAQELFIHRTSLLVRLDRIKQLTGVTFENYEERLHLMLSLMIWE